MKIDEKKFVIECTGEQLKLIDTALEEYMRVRMGQFFDLATDLAMKNYDYSDHSEANRKEFDYRIRNRNDSEETFNAAFRAALPHYNFNEIYWRKNEDQLLAEDMWDTIRHQLWLSDPRPDKPQHTVDAYPPLILSLKSGGFKVNESELSLHVDKL